MCGSHFLCSLDYCVPHNKVTYREGHYLQTSINLFGTSHFICAQYCRYPAGGPLMNKALPS